MRRFFPMIRAGLAVLIPLLFSLSALADETSRSEECKPLEIKCPGCQAKDLDELAKIAERLRAGHDAVLARALERVGASWVESSRRGQRFDVGVGADKNKKDAREVINREKEKLQSAVDKAHESHNLRNSGKAEDALLDHMQKHGH